jgi:prolyl-tRNA editing enzyme YbaK/EbsC (Cys-tRNA(Pro) deacylase)
MLPRTPLIRFATRSTKLVTESLGNPAILEAIRTLLMDRSIEFREQHHEPTLTSEDAARARGEDLRIGGKALLMSADGAFRLFVLPADRKVDSGAIRRELGIKKMRFATREELHALTGLVPGSVPPFGTPVLPYPLYLDSALRDNDRIAFNAGMLTDSIILKMSDYLTVAAPEQIFAFSEMPLK